ncbi:binding-protein-dependent transport systems inner membrane component [Candidatus Vecturithrix granuli]|uniref:Binding-protein-dependent transport systems inner membrane component n=1 Tax=Vecturithrix granuli TaxID=1499967 RepID=A0A081C5I3_VECG1|nr:binding-protein-dependent transport systems inner membrane component [Candidatus Vecturithrix granuli]
MKKKSYYAKLQNHGYLFILPTLVFFSIFLILPMINAFYLSLFKWNLVSPKVYVGFNNFFTLWKDKRFWNSYYVTVHFTFVSVVIIIFLAFWLALAFKSHLRCKNLLQSMIFLPVVLTMVAVAIVWQFMFQTTGLLSYLFLRIFGINMQWLTSTKVAPYAMILVYVWKVTGYYMVIFIAGLLNIPDVYYEAATVDGAGFWRKLIHITLPQLKNTIILAFVSCVIFSFGTFAQQYVMTEGEPSRSTEVVALLIYKTAFIYTKFGYSSAISVVYFLTLLIFAMIQLKIFKSESV